MRKPTIAEFARMMAGADLAGISPWQEAVLRHIERGGIMRMPTEIEVRQAQRKARREWLEKAYGR